MADASSAEGPVVHKRFLVGGPPSDLPDDRLSYPGKPLTHRFIPTESIRRVEVARAPDQPKLATDIPFKPVASVGYPDKKIHLAPVSNIRSRGLQPPALSGTVTLPAGAAKVFELSDDLRRPLETRFGRLATPPEKETTPT